MPGPSGLLDRFLGAAVTFLLAAGALYFGAELIRTVWVELVVVAVVVLVAGVGLAVWRYWPRGW